VKVKLPGRRPGRRLTSGATALAPEQSLDRVTAKKISGITKWAETQARTIIEKGRSLSAVEFELALRLGVQHPEEILVLPVPAIPLPKEAFLKRAIEEFALITSSTKGFTVGYNIFLVTDSLTQSVMAHELVHVAQFEQLEGIPKFFQKYLLQIGEYGYANAPMEQDALAISAKFDAH
jgi:hypothetical protein